MAFIVSFLVRIAIFFSSHRHFVNSATNMNGSGLLVMGRSAVLVDVGVKTGMFLKVISTLSFYKFPKHRNSKKKDNHLCLRDQMNLHASNCLKS